MTLERKLNFSTHANKINNKCQKCLNILYSLTDKKMVSRWKKQTQYLQMPNKIEDGIRSSSLINFQLFQDLNERYTI